MTASSPSLVFTPIRIPLDVRQPFASSHPPPNLSVNNLIEKPKRSWVIVPLAASDLYVFVRHSFPRCRKLGVD